MKGAEGRRGDGGGVREAWAACRVYSLETKKTVPFLIITLVPVPRACGGRKAIGQPSTQQMGGMNRP